MKRGLYLAPFDELANPRLLADPRVALGVADDLEPFGEAVDPRERGRLLDEPGTARLTSIEPQPPEPEVRAVVDAGP
jgi:hypothetical protein